MLTNYKQTHPSVHTSLSADLCLKKVLKIVEIMLTRRHKNKQPMSEMC